MKDRIKQLCRRIEDEKNVRILFAVENGSRAWRMESEDSDYDVRFVYVRPVEDYIQINVPRDVIEAAFDEAGKPVARQGALIDMAGFDVFKFVKMLSSSNPTTIEWLMTDMVYYGKQNAVFKEYASRHFNPIALYHHYKSMCRNNYLKYLKSGNQVTYKKYLYAYRGLVNAKFVLAHDSVPPIVFDDALRLVADVLPDHIIERLRDIIAKKADGQEQDIVDNIPSMDRYIEQFLKDEDEAPNRKSHATLTDLNAELRRIVLQK